MTKALFLVSCVSQKRPGRSKARDLYLSPWFLKARDYVEATGMPWFILSAEHGLLDPDSEVSPYEKTLNTMPVGERRAWASRVLEALLPHAARSEEVVILAGDRYREFLMPKLKASSRTVRVPMEGLKIGYQLQWLGANAWRPE